MRKPIEMGLGFYLILPATLRSPKNQNDTTTKDPCCKETFISAECVCSISRECELRGVSAYVCSPIRARGTVCARRLIN